MRRLAISAVIPLLFASPAFGASCSQPYAPDISNSASRTKAQLLQVRDDVQSFIEASDIYQQCLIEAAKNDPKLHVAALLDANQRDKQRVANAFNLAAHSFNSAQVDSGVQSARN
jgi:hypothetical protein